MSEKAHKDGDTVIEWNPTTDEGAITVMEGIDTVCESGYDNAPQTEAEAMTDEEKARLSEQTINQILEKIQAITTSPSPRHTQDGKYTLGKRLGDDDQYEYYEAEEADTDKAVRLMMPLPHSIDNAREEAWIQAAMKTESRASRCAFDSNTAANGQNPVLCWYSPEDTVKERKNHYFGLGEESISYLVSYQPWGMSFYEWEKRRPAMSEAQAVSLTIELLSALEGLHSSRYSYYLGQEATGKPLVHRLVHPENIRIVQNDDKDTPHLLLTGFCNATPAGYVDHSIDPVDFPPPCSSHFSCREQLLGKPPRQAWDVWGAAACLYYFLTGETVRRPCKGTFLDVVNAPTIPINEQGRLIRTPRLAEIIDGALNGENSLQYETAQALKTALSDCIAPDCPD